MNTSTTPIIESETEFCPPELFYPQIAGLEVAIGSGLERVSTLTSFTITDASSWLCPLHTVAQ